MTKHGLQQIPVSEFRRDLADYFIEAVYKQKPIIITRHEKEKVFLLGEEVFQSLLDEIKKLKPTLKTQILPEENGSFTLSCEELGIYANAETLDQAKEEFLEVAKDYAEDYLADLPLYLRDPTRSSHFPFVMAISQSTDAKIYSLLGLVNHNLQEP